MVVVVIIYYYIIIGCKYKATRWYLTGLPNGSNLGANSIMSGRNLPLYCTLILIAMQSHQSQQNINTVVHSEEDGTNNVDNKQYVREIRNGL